MQKFRYASRKFAIASYLLIHMIHQGSNSAIPSTYRTYFHAIYF